MTPRIIIEVSGGVVQSVYADRPVSVDVLDHDNAKGGDMTDAELEAHEKLEAETQKLKAYF